MKVFRVGFTGTQQGMTSRQKKLLRAHFIRLAKKHDHIELHHGDCVGADAECHTIAVETLQDRLTVVLHPPTNSYKRAYCTSPGQITLPALPYLDRNQAIVDAVDGMFATPEEEEEQLRSGTWATVRRARKRKRPLIILNP